MKGVGTLDLDDTEYTLTPAETLGGPNTIPFKEIVTGKDIEDYSLYDVLDSTETRVLEIVISVEQSIEGEGLVKRQKRDAQLAFRSPDGEGHLSLRRSGWGSGLLARPTYELRAIPTDETLVTWERDFPVVWNWVLREPTGTVAATVTKPWMAALLNAASFSRQETLTVTTPRGTEVAQFDRVRAEGALTGMLLSDLQITMAASTIPTEIVLGLGFGLLFEHFAGGEFQS